MLLPLDHVDKKEAGGGGGVTVAKGQTRRASHLSPSDTAWRGNECGESMGPSQPIGAQMSAQHTVSHFKRQQAPTGEPLSQTVGYYCFLTKQGHHTTDCQSDQRWNCLKLKGNVGETSKRRDGAHEYMGFSERTDTTDPN